LLPHTTHTYDARLYTIQCHRSKLYSQPAAQAAAPQSSISCASYDARAAGVGTNMTVGAAARLCPGLWVTPYDFHGYAEASMQLYKCLLEFTCDVEVVSVDEAFVQM
jgi:DNA polymerase-4